MISVQTRRSDLGLTPGLLDDDRRELLTLAKAVIGQALQTSRRELPIASGLPSRLREPGASFVRLRRGQELLGSGGSLRAARSLGVDVADHALVAAFDDPCMPPVMQADYPEMGVEISVMGELAEADARSFLELRHSLRPAVDGVVIETTECTATFLPDVWRDVRDVDDFLSLLWRKAGLAAGDWPSDLHVSIFRTESFSDAAPA